MFQNLLIGTGGARTNPGLEIGNPLPAGWTNLYTDFGALGATGAAGVAPVVLGIANQMTSGAATSGSVLSLDAQGNLGIAGALGLGGPPNNTNFVSIGATSGFVSSSPGLGSLYMRYDAGIGPRFFQFSPSTPHGTWRPIPVGLGFFNVKDYGAVGDGVTDDAAAQQAAVNDAVSNPNNGGVIYYPPGNYLTASSCVLVTKIPGGLVFAGAGAASTILTNADQDILVVSGGANGLTVQDLQFRGPVLVGGNVPISGSAIRLVGGGGQFRVLNVVTSGTAYGLRGTDNQGGAGQMIGCNFNGEYVGVYITAGAEIHNSSIAGGTYGLVLDGSNGMKLFDVDLYGALPLSMRNAPATSGQNSFYGFDVEANFVRPPSGASGRHWPSEGIGAAYLVPTGGQLHLVDCDFPGGTLIGGNYIGTTWIPEDVTINGGHFSAGFGSFNLSGVILIGVPNGFTTNALDIQEGANVTVGGAVFGTGPLVTGYGLNVGVDVNALSIVGNNFTGLGAKAAGAINIAPSGGINCQGNLVQAGLPSGGIFWPSTTSAPFAVANNPGFNPTGVMVTLSTAVGTNDFTNQYGVPGTYYVSGSAVGNSVSIYDVLSASYSNTGLATGNFHLLPGGKLRIVVATSAPAVVFIGD